MTTLRATFLGIDNKLVKDIKDVVIDLIFVKTEPPKLILILDREINHKKAKILSTVLKNRQEIRDFIKDKYDVDYYEVDIVVDRTDTSHFDVSSNKVKKLRLNTNKLEKTVSYLSMMDEELIRNADELMEVVRDLQDVSSRNEAKLILEVSANPDYKLLEALIRKTLNEIFTEETYKIDLDSIPDDVLREIVEKLKESMEISVVGDYDPREVLTEAINTNKFVRKFVIKYLKSRSPEIKKRGRPRRGGGKND